MWQDDADSGSMPPPRAQTGRYSTLQLPDTRNRCSRKRGRAHATRDHCRLRRTAVR